MLKKIFRNGSTDVLVVISMVIVFVVLLYLAPLIRTLSILQEKMDGYSYEKYYEVLFVEYNEEGILSTDMFLKDDFYQFVDELQQFSSANWYVYASVDFTKRVSFYSGKILLKQNEQVLEQFIQAKKEVRCAFSPILDEYRIEDRKDVIKIGSLDYPWDGQLTKNDMETYAFYADFTSLNQEQKQYLQNQIYENCKTGSIIFCLASQSNLNDIANQFEQLCQKYTANIQDITNEVVKGMGQSKSIYQLINKYTLFLCLILAIMNCINVSVVYVKKKTKEYAIRKACGYSDIDVWLLNLKNIGKDFLIAVFLSVFLLSVLLWNMETDIGIVHVIFVFVGSFVICFLVQTILLKHIIKIEPAAILQSQVF